MSYDIYESGNAYGSNNFQSMVLPNRHAFITHIDYAVEEASGVTILIVTSCLSLLAALGLLAAMLASAIITRNAPKDTKLFVRTQVAPYFASLLVCDVLQAIGSIMNARWVSEQGVTYSQFCESQGTIKQMADVGSAIWSLIIAVHTFNILFLEIAVHRNIMYMTLVAGWALIGCLVMGGPAAMDQVQNGPFFAISGYWCWISPEYPVQRIVLDYLVMFLSAGFCFILYVLIFLRIRGNIIREFNRFTFRRTGSRRGNAARQGQYGRTVAQRMVWYPVAYTTLLLPIAIDRFVTWSGGTVSFEATIFCDTVFLMSGIVNVTMFLGHRGRTLIPPKGLLTSSGGTSKPHSPTSSVSDQTYSIRPTVSRSSVDSKFLASMDSESHITV